MGLGARVHSAAGAGLAAAVVVLAGVVRREVGEMMFTEENLAKIRTAVCEAERRTRGEIVPMIVPRSAQYREAGHALGVILALITLSTLLLWDRPGWGGILSPAWILLAVVVAYGVGDYAGLLPATIRLLTSKERIDSAVRRRAEAAFYEHGLHKTREGTGILIMLPIQPVKTPPSFPTESAADCRPLDIVPAWRAARSPSPRSYSRQYSSPGSAH